jgi:hypothetical protein
MVPADDVVASRAALAGADASASRLKFRQPSTCGGNVGEQHSHSAPKVRLRPSSVPHGQRVYVRENVHTNTIEGFFSLLKNGIRGTYHSVSPHRLDSYANEYVWRYNHRDDDAAQFRTLLWNAASELH